MNMTGMFHPIEPFWRMRPRFLIIGAQKAGTTALHYYLARHPSLYSGARKELGYFSHEMFREWEDHPYRTVFDRLEHDSGDPAVHRKGLRWYRSRFPWIRPWRRALAFESTPAYLASEQAPQRIAAYQPDMKLIAILRDPVERAYSAWNMMNKFSKPPYNRLRDERSFETAIEDEFAQMEGAPASGSKGYLRRGIYHIQIKRYFELFEKKNMLILEHRDFEEETARILEQVCDFLDVPRFAKGKEWPRILAGDYDQQMSASMRDRLRKFFAPHNAQLGTLLGRDVDHWA